MAKSQSSSRIQLQRDSSDVEEDSSQGSSRASPSREDALAALQAHFADSFDVPVMEAPAGKQKKKSRKSNKEKVPYPQETGLSTSKPSEADTNPRHLQEASVKKQKEASQPETVVFSDTSARGTPAGRTTENATGWRQFMTSKVSTRTEKEREAERASKKPKTSTKKKEKAQDEEEEDAEDEKQAQSNDRALSELLGTTLFAPGGAGSQTTRSNGRPILGSNDTLARLLELSQPSMTGKAQSQGRGLGNALLKSQDMSKMPANIRHGMRRAEMENQERELQQQKELGNYHHSIKGLVTKKEGLDLILGTKEKDKAKRKRDQGLSMGVGKFSGGMLKLSEQDIQRINRPNGRSANSKKRKV